MPGWLAMKHHGPIYDTDIQCNKICLGYRVLCTGYAYRYNLLTGIWHFKHRYAYPVTGHPVPNVMNMHMLLLVLIPVTSWYGECTAGYRYACKPLRGIFGAKIRRNARDFATGHVAMRGICICCILAMCTRGRYRGTLAGIYGDMALQQAMHTKKQTKQLPVATYQGTCY